MKHLPQAKNNSLFSNSLFIFLTRFFPSLASTVIVIYFSRQLNKEVYGAYQNFWIQLNLLYPIACFGVHVLLITYSASFLVKLKDWLSSNSYYLFGLWLMLLSGVFAFLQHKALHIHFAIPYLFLFTFSLSFIFESVLIVFKGFKTLVLVNVLYAIAFLLAHWLMLHGGYSLNWLFLCLLGISLFRFVCYAIVAAVQMNRQVADGESNVDVKSIRSLWLHLGVYDVVQNSSNWIDKFAISVLFTAQVSAVYANGTLNIPFLPILLSAAGSAVLLQLGGVNNDDNKQQALALVNQSGKMLSCIMFPLFFFFVLFRYELFDVVFSGKYTASVPLFLISILAIPVRAYSFTTILQNRHKGAIINKGAIGELILACILMYPLYLLMGLPGIALSFIISTYLQAGYYLFQTSLLLEVSVNKLIPIVNWLLKLIVFATVFIVIHYLFNLYFTELISLILGVLLSTICIAVSLWIEFKTAHKYDEA